MGTGNEIQAAAQAGAYFSVNSGMSQADLAALPPDRVLPETDYPSRQTRAKRPADVTAVERAVGEVWDISAEEARIGLWTNLRAVTIAAGVLDRLPDALGDMLLEF